MLTRLTLAAVAAFLLATGSGSAQALYDTPAPPDSAFVRVLHAPGDPAAPVAVGGVTLQANADGKALYSVLKEGHYAVGLPDGRNVDLDTAAQTFYSVLVGRDPAAPPVVIQDPVVDNPAKATLLFYNLSSQPGADLATADGKTVVIDAIDPLKSGSRQVNAVSIGFAVVVGGAIVATAEPIKLERGAFYTLIYSADGKLTAYEGGIALAKAN